MSDIPPPQLGAPPPPDDSAPTALPEGLPEDATPALPGEPSPISDAALPAVAEQLRPLLAEVVKVAVEEAIAAVPTPTLRPGTVQTIDMSTKTATITLDEATEEVGTCVAQIISEIPVVNDRVMVLFVPPHAAYVIGFVGGAPAVPAGSLIAYTGPITAPAGGSSDRPPPRGYLWAYGQDYDGAAYPALWAAIGTTHGTGAATGSGKVPDMRGRLPLGIDNMGGSDAGRLSVANVVGASGGAESHTLTTANLPSHAHSLNNHTHSFSASVTGSISVSGTTGIQNANHTHLLPGRAVAEFLGYGQNTPVNGNATNPGGDTTSGISQNHQHSFSASGSISGGSVSGTTGGSSVNTSSVGSGTAVNHLPPYLMVHWIIRA